jgi:sugar phosphate permease
MVKIILPMVVAAVIAFAGGVWTHHIIEKSRMGHVSEASTSHSDFNLLGTPAGVARTVFLIFVPFAAGYFLSYFFRTINALICGTLIAEFRLGAHEIGLLTSVYFLSAIIQLPLGVMVDRYGPRRVQSALLLVAAAGAALFAAGGGLWTLVLGRTLLGIGAGSALISGFKAIVLWFPRERLALVNGCFVMLGACGAITATVPAQTLLASIGWRGLFELLAVITALCGIVTFVVVPEPSVVVPRWGSMNLRAVFSDHRFWRLAPLSTMCISTAWALQGLWATPWLQDVEGLGASAIVSHLFVMAVALSAGSLLLGICANVMRHRGMQARDVLASATLLFVTVEIALVTGVPVSSFALWSIIASLGGASVLTYAILADYFPPAVIGQANAALSTCHIAGAFALQYGFGFVVDRWAGVGGHYPPVAYRTAFVLVIVLQIAALAWFALPDKATIRRLLLSRGQARPVTAMTGEIGKQVTP